MRAEGCDYRAVRYDTVEQALRENARRLIKEAPRGQNTAALEKKIDALQNNADGAEEQMSDLAELIARERGSPEATAAAKRLREIDRYLKDTQRHLRDLRAQRDTLTTASVKDRLKSVERALASNTDVVETNATLRDAIRRIVLDPEQGMLWVRWHHSDETQGVPCITRHYKWERMQEAREPLSALFPERAADAKQIENNTAGQ